LHTGNSILMRAPRTKIFETAADLSRWPEFLPHYRYIHYYERSPERNVVKMAAVRTGIPIAWVSEQWIDRERCEVRFRHLKAFTKGMEVVWTFAENADGVLVSILHDLKFRVPALAPLADPIIGGFFIEYVAGRTLECMKRHVEGATV
jgi:ribosome-associated toxin RatA of RatAB toxin-antitoxin module